MCICAYGEKNPRRIPQPSHNCYHAPFSTLKKDSFVPVFCLKTKKSILVLVFTKIFGYCRLHGNARRIVMFRN